ncbi:hypothetical protein DXG01_009031 [Tephrocybe rancida]|nr:hypothetical protein DXG01_009031 [Tephrocybe rancida]
MEWTIVHHSGFDRSTRLKYLHRSSHSEMGSQAQRPFDYLVNHIFLPPKLPQSDDASIDNDLSVCDLVIRNAQLFSASLSPDPLCWGPIVRMLVNLMSLCISPSLDERELQGLIAQLTGGESLVIPVRAQNACVFVRRLDAAVIYESFEVDPPNEQIMAPTGRLVRSFPGPAHKVADTTTSTAFGAELASFLAAMDFVDVESAATTKKAGSMVFEARDTADPHYITQLLTSIIHGCPGSEPADIDRVQKRVRNEIMWDRAYAPWRRSPLWLIIRVALQTTLRRGSANGQTEYKSFMIFLLADIVLSGDDCCEFSTDVLVCIQNKIVRRLRKLSDAASDALVGHATRAICKAKEIVEARWNDIRTRQALSPPWDPETLDVTRDTVISLLSSKEYISSRLQHHTTALARPSFEPTEARRLKAKNLLQPTALSMAISSDPFVALADVEQFSVDGLEAWVDKHRDSSSACINLGDSIIIYATSARSQYKDNPEDQSLMLLTVFLLWSALDRLAVSQHPALADYSPEVPETILNPLLLRKFNQLEAVTRLRKYLRMRHRCTCQGSVFSERLTSSSFAIRYFCSSNPLQELKREIEAKAKTQRNQKREEFARLKEKHTTLVNEAQSMAHDHRFGYPCRKCSLTRKASKMKIDVHEWPLPQDQFYAQAAVFELQCPPVFQSWRTTTYSILYDFCRPNLPINGTSPKAEIELAKYLDLRSHCRRQTRVTFASPTKPFIKSHYSIQKVANVASDLSSILVNNGISYRLFDTKLKRWAGAWSFSDCSVAELCRFRLPATSPYYSLQYAMDGTTHSANQPLADQAEVRPELSIHEHIVFGGLRSGPMVQWLNILRELRAGTLSFDRFEVHLLVTQAALQTGSVDVAEEELEWHTVLKRPDFGLALLSEIDDMLSSVESNWHHTNTLQTLTILTTRLLASSLNEEVITRACSTLRTARMIAFSWVVRLSQGSKPTNDEALSALMRQRMCMAAATCRTTYDVDPPYLGRLMDLDEDISVCVQCAIHIQNNTPPGGVPFELGLILARDRRLSQRLAPALWARIEANRTGFDNSVLAIWSDYQRGSDWKQLNTPNERWLTSTISDVPTNSNATIHYNLVDGTLLINGKPLGRLPSSIVSHPTYVRLLKNRILEVVPSTLPTMHFASQNPIFAPDFYLHFQLPDPGGNLIIQGKVGADIYELVPHTVFGEESARDLPLSLIDEYAHWLRLSPASDTAHLTLHPLESVWKPSKVNWELDFAPRIGGGKMKAGGLVMVDIRSKTFDTISKRLKPLEVAGHVHITLDTEGTLSIRLPRFKLVFFVNDNRDLECSTIRDMVVDLHQSSGTMFGLTNQLVLRAKSLRTTRVAAPGSRRVIIPFGSVSFHAGRFHHSEVQILLGDGPSQKYFLYEVDTSLERLMGTTLMSDIYKTYLHACTSFPLSDDLTGRTGTEEALCQLESARYFSFQDLTLVETKFLYDIARLTPSMKWYPEHLKAMNTTRWSKIGPLAQHWAFAPLVDKILLFHQQLSLINGSPTEHLVDRADPHLLARLDSRTPGLYASPEKYISLLADVAYPSSEDPGISRRHGKPKETTLLIANVSAFAYDTTPPIDTVPDLWDLLKVIQVLKADDTAQDLNKDWYRRFISPHLADLFLPLYRCFSQGQSSATSICRVVFTLSTMAYTSSADGQIKRLIPTFLSFARCPEFRSISLPPPNEYDLDVGVKPERGALVSLLQDYSLQPKGEPTRNFRENDHQYASRCKAYWEPTIRKQTEGVADILTTHWPCKVPSLPLKSGFNLLDLRSSNLAFKMSQLFLRWYNNMNLRDFVDRVQSVLDGVHVSLSSPIPATMQPYHTPLFPVDLQPHPRHLPATLEDLFLHREPPAVSFSHSHYVAPAEAGADTFVIPASITQASRLTSIVEQFRQGPRTLHRHYGDALKQSLESHESRGIEIRSTSGVGRVRPDSASLLMTDYEWRRRQFNDVLKSIRMALSPNTLLEVAVYQAGQWPIPTVRALLNLLSKDKLGATMPPAWETVMVTLAQRLVQLQRSRRALHFKHGDREEDLSKELENTEYEADVSFCDPEWLLIQIDSNFTVRPVQSRVAQEMITPHSEKNSLTQLNMGEGKSAVIVPLVASTLADGRSLVRVVTLKPLVNQTFVLLVRRLSGLAKRRVFYMPFSRDFQPDSAHLDLLRQLYELCVRERGILLVQPEHILSFRLMGVDIATGTRVEAAKSLLESYRWLSSISRDVLDESDEILRVTYQLVYTSGLQEAMDNHPDRWAVIQELIGYAQKHANILQPMYRNGLEVQQEGEYGCPIIRILDVEAGEALINSVTTEVLLSERFKLLPSRSHLAASDFLRCTTGSATALESLRSFLHGSTLWKHLLLCRGLLGHGLLRFVLQEKRWRVDYGLDPTRTLLAVPYRAKDLPSLRADFGHPDVALALTCLSYYYGGLSAIQLDECFELLFKLDDPSLAYNHWVSGQSQIPLAFRDIKGVNLDDHHQRKSILEPLFRKNKAVIDFYLSNVVFPRYAKQFPKKLSTSSWDLAEIKDRVTTGFSGTNDNRYLLPTSIEQQNITGAGDQDPFGQLATNAKVLSILLQPENDRYCCLQGSNGQSPTGSDFLDLLVSQSPPIRVLLDVGAQMLDMQNIELVSRWLSLVPEIYAVVFFSDVDELVVMSRDQHIESFVSSQYNQKLDLCAVYLDDAHTRGTDLKLPNDFRAVVTLGPKLVKDRLVQGCMRMRQLGRGQSLIFFAPLEVDRSIRACKLSPLEPSAEICSADILRWSMWQTCEHIQQYLPHWAQQGVEYKHRNDAWVLHESDPSAPNALQHLRSSWEEPDARNLEEMYEEQPNIHATSHHPAFQLPHLKERLNNLGITDLGDFKTDEEQERQVSKEAERERQRELPPKVEPALSSLHKALKVLVQSGQFESGPTSPFIPLFSPLAVMHQWSTALFSTKDFATTIKGGASTGDFLRPVNWILSVPQHSALVVISPFEANELLSMIWSSKHVHLHIYTLRVNKNMKTTEDLRFFSIPPLPTSSSDPLMFIPDLMMQLNLWAGQLYLKDVEMYQRLCRLLGLVGAEPGPRNWDSDGFVKPEDRTGAMKELCQMNVSPVIFLKELFSLRRKGMGYVSTHMGKVLNAKPLGAKDFED